MRIRHDRKGDIVLDAEFLAPRFSMSVDALRQLMRWGAFQSRVELGQVEDTGRRRISLRCGNRIWQAVLNADGDIISEGIRHVPAQPPGSTKP